MSATFKAFYNMKRQFACKINKNNLTAALFHEKV